MALLHTLERIARWNLGRRGFASRMVETSAGEVHLYDSPGRGELPTVVVIHGLGSNAATFMRTLIRLQRSSRRVLAPEILGHGMSPEPSAQLTPDSAFEAMGELLVEQLDEPAILFGNSLGGGLALRFAAEHPDLVCGLVLSSPAGAPFEPEKIDSFMDVFRFRDRAEARLFLDRIYVRTPWYGNIVASGVMDHFARPSMSQFLSSVTGDHFASTDQLAGLAMPVLLLWGKQERLLPSEQLGFFRKHLPDHAVIEEPGDFSHSPHLEHPIEVAERIVAFGRDVCSMAGRG